MLAIFFTAFFTKQEILWAIALVLSGVLAFTSYNIEYYVYVFNMTSQVYDAVPVSAQYIYLMGLNLIFFSLCIILGLTDIFDKYKLGFKKQE